MRRSRRVPAPSHPQLLRLRGIEEGEELLERQGTPRASGFRPRQGFGPEEGPTFGGGTSPIKTGQPIHREDVGKLVEWAADGYIRIARHDYLREAPADGQPYLRAGGEWVVLGNVSGTVSDAPTDGRTYTRTGYDGRWDPLPYIIAEAPEDGQGYVRVGLNRGWAPALTLAATNARYAPISTVSFPEAPNDGLVYGRRGWDHTWIAVGSGAGIGEAPTDGQGYLRHGASQSWRVGATQDYVDGAVGRVAVVAATPPVNPFPGGLWYDSSTGYLKVWDGAEWTLSSGPLQVLTEPVYEYYVATNGDDVNNDGTTPAQPWRTLQTAITWIFNNLDFNRRQVILHVADGNYDGFVIQGVARGLDTPGGMVIRGNLADPAAVTITGGGPAIGVGNGARLLIEGMTLIQLGASQFPQALLVWSDALVFYNRIHFGAATWAHIGCVSGGAAYIVGPCSVIASAPVHYEISDGGEIGTWNNPDWPGPNVVTMVDNPHFSGAFAHASDRSGIALDSGVVSFIGTATGNRYHVERLSIINVGGGGLDFFPGDQPGDPATSGVLTASGGLYIA